MRRIRFALAALCATFVFTAPASAAPTTIGSQLTGFFESSFCPEFCTAVSTGFNEPGALVTSPIDGTIVRWRIEGGARGFLYRLRTVTPASPFTFFGGGTSAPGEPAGPGPETFRTNLPIRAGQMIGLDLEPFAPIGYREESLADTYAFFEPPLLDGQARGSETFEGEVAFSAEIQTPPVISAVSPAAGTFRGIGEKVIIYGSEFTGVTGVSFGSTPAASFLELSDTQIEASVPILPKPGVVPISVTTPVGSATGPATYRGLACKVPQLKGRKVKAAKKRASRSRCKVIKVKKVKGRPAKAGKVIHQIPKAGSLLIPGGGVKITVVQ